MGDQDPSCFRRPHPGESRMSPAPPAVMGFSSAGHRRWIAGEFAVCVGLLLERRVLASNVLTASAITADHSGGHQAPQMR